MPTLIMQRMDSRHKSKRVFILLLKISWKDVP